MNLIFPSNECVICMDSPSTHLFEPCNHAITCQVCSDQVVNAKITCPICRHLIENVTTIKEYEYEYTKKLSKLQLDDFVENYRGTYLKRLQSTVASNAGAVGKNKFSRSINYMFGDEFENVVIEGTGTERYTSKKVDHKIIENKSGETTLKTSYKVGRRKKDVESFPLMTVDRVFQCIVDPLTVLELATHYPQEYWALHYHTNGKIEEILEKNSMLQTKRKRKRKL